MFPKAPASVNAPLRLFINFFLITLLCIFSHAQQSNEILTDDVLKAQISSQRHEIELAMKDQSSNERLGYLWAVLGAQYRRAGDFSQSEHAYLKAADLQRDVPSATRNYATTLDNFGTMYLVFGRIDEAERYNRMGAKIREQMGYKLDVARSEVHMAEIDLARHRFREAERESASALQAMREGDDPEVLDVLTALNALAYTHCLRGRCGEGLAAANESVSLARERCGEQSVAFAHAQQTLGFALWKSGHLQEAEVAMLWGIDLMRRQPDTIRRPLMMALTEYRDFLRDQRRPTDIVAVDMELTKTQEGSACPYCVNAKSFSAR